VTTSTPSETDWDPGRYLRFAEPRTRPALDLLARLDDLQPERIYDLGCGTGHVTRLLAERWPAAAVVGVDGSEEMLKRAAAVPGRVAWKRADIATWEADGPTGLIFSNAALHWVPDHTALLPRLMRQLVPGGVLAVQIPWNWDRPSHRLIREVLEGAGPGGNALSRAPIPAGLARTPVALPEDYLDILETTAHPVDLWSTDYFHRLEGPSPVLEWTRGTTLRPILEVLAPAERERFLDAYGERLAEAYPPRADGTTLFPFRRLFLLARRKT
jgi:trans-aconitate 2-methyltransferase